MGQDFCKGCRDCENDNGEEDISKQANPPLTNINNAFFFNNNKTTTSINDANQINNESFLNNFNNNNKNESFTTTSRIPYNDLEDNKNNKIKNINSLNLDEAEKEKLKQIKMNNSSRKITNMFRQYKILKDEAHQILCKEYSNISSSEFISDLNHEELQVNLAPEMRCLYLGTKFNNRKDGLGLEIFEQTNSKYFGIFLNNKRVQAGRFKIKNDFKDYFYNGQVMGIYAFGFGWFKDKKNHSSYIGYWKNSMKDGYGYEKYNDKSRYKGTFLNGQKSGIGYYKWADGSSYEGEWKNNKLHGFGIYLFKDGSYYQGEWKRNRMHGYGEFIYPEIKTYVGYFNRDNREGFGMLFWHKEKKAFIGFWKNNQQNGIGKFFANNKIRYGIWDQGQLKEKIKNKESFYKKLTQKEEAYLSYLRIDDYNSLTEIINKYIN